MPPDVREAKNIRRLIIEKTEGVPGSKDKAFAADDLDEDAEVSEYEENNIADEVEGEQGSNNGGIVGMGQHRDAVGVARGGANVAAAGAVVKTAAAGAGDVGTPRQRVSCVKNELVLNLMEIYLTCS
jgi:hypothetical protein